MKKIIIMSLIMMSFIYGNDMCRNSYSKVTKNTERADVFLKGKDWQMANFYLKKLKTNYTMFIRNDCFDKVFKKTNVKRMKRIYRQNIIRVRNLSEMTEETIKEKRRVERQRAIEQIDLEAKIKKDAIKREIREEMLREGR